MLEKDPNHKFGLIGCIGKDNYGEIILENLKKVDVETILEISETELSSRCAVGIVNKERCLVPQIRASNKLSLDFVKNNLTKILEAEILYIEGYFVIDCWDIVKFLANEFKKSGKRVAFCLSAVFMVQVFFDRIKEISDLADIIFGNEEESAAFAEKLGHVKGSDKENAAFILKSLEKVEGRIVLITHGSQPTVGAVWNNETSEFKEILEIPTVHVESDKIEDTNGCGDAFAGGFLSFLIKGNSLENSIKAGLYSSSVIIQHLGATFSGSPTFTI